MLGRNLRGRAKVQVSDVAAKSVRTGVGRADSRRSNAVSL
jgi:hypothetical protein